MTNCSIAYASMTYYAQRTHINQYNVHVFIRSRCNILYATSCPPMSPPHTAQTIPKAAASASAECLMYMNCTNLIFKYQ